MNKLLQFIQSTVDFKERLFILCLPKQGFKLCLKKDKDIDLTDSKISFHESYDIISEFSYAYPTAIEAIQVFEAILLESSSAMHAWHIPSTLEVYAQAIHKKINDRGKVYHEYGSAVLIYKLQRQAFSNAPSFWS